MKLKSSKVNLEISSLRVDKTEEELKRYEKFRETISELVDENSFSGVLLLLSELALEKADNFSDLGISKESTKYTLASVILKEYSDSLKV